MSHPIVVGYDGSEAGDIALAWAARESDERRIPLQVLVAWSVPPVDVGAAHDALMDATVVEGSREYGQDVLDRSVARATELGGYSVTGSLVLESAAAALVEASKEASLVITGSAGRGGFIGMLLGSVSRQVATHAKCPAVIVRTPADKAAREIVVGVDGSEPALVALDWAFAQADRHALPLRVLHTWDIPPVGAITGVPTFSAPELLEDLRSSEIRTTAEALAGQRGRYPDVAVTQDIQRGSPIHALIESSQHASMVVVGSRGRGGFLGLLLGSVSHGVAHHAMCTVAVVRQPEWAGRG